MELRQGQLPAPPLPSWIDLRGVPYMPVDVVRLRDCRIAVEEAPEVYKAASLLWWAAWHQVPSGSLPNNERQLTQLAGLGKATSKWRAILGLDEEGKFPVKRLAYALTNGSRIHPASRENSGGAASTPALNSTGSPSESDPLVPPEHPHYFGHLWAIDRGALTHFVLCSDGRLYHPLICELAVREWNVRAAAEFEKAYDRVRKNNRTREKRGEAPVKLLRPDDVLFAWLNLTLDADQKLFTDFHRKHPQKSTIDVGYRAADGRVVPFSWDSTSVLKNKNVSKGVVRTNPKEPKEPSDGVLIEQLPPEVAKPENVQGVTTPTWRAYADAYFRRYGVEPLRNATVSSQLKLLIKRVGADNAPIIAAFYVTMNTHFYVLKMHAVGPLVKDAEAIYAQWKTGKPITAARARQVDATAANQDAFKGLIERQQQLESEG